MKFYILKSTYQRKINGDVIIDQEQIESLMIAEKFLQDRENPIYVVRFTMRSMDYWTARFNSKEDLKKVLMDLSTLSSEEIQDLLDNGVVTKK